MFIKQLLIILGLKREESRLEHYTTDGLQSARVLIFFSITMQAHTIG